MADSDKVDAAWEALQDDAFLADNAWTTIEAHRPLIEAAIRAEAEATVTALRRSLLRLRDHGYQPMHNGRPSCPFCSAFVDDEETHDPGCILVAALAATPEEDVQPGGIKYVVGADPFAATPEAER